MVALQAGDQSIFTTEAEEQLDRSEALLLDAEDAASFSADSVAEVFRLVHTLKGSAAMVGYATLADTAHLFEDVLAQVRDRVSNGQPFEKAQITRIVGLGLDFCDTYRNAINDPDAYQQDNAFAVLNRAIGVYLKEGDSAEKNAAGEGVASDDVYPQDLFRYQRVRIYLHKCGMACLRASMFVRAIAPLCESTYTMPADIATKSDQNDKILQEGFELGFVCKKHVIKDAVLQRLREQPLFDRMDSIESAKPAPQTLSSVATTLSVPAQDVAELLEIVGQAITAGVLMGQHLKDEGTFDATVETYLGQLHRCSMIVQDGLVGMGLMRIDTVLLPIKRLVRKLARESGKQVEVVLSEEGVTVDKSVMEALSESFLHLARNAVDHGIETPEERIRVGKPVAGLITIHAKQDHERLIVSMQDDGRGINRERILQKAREQGLLDKPDETYSDDDLCEFILQSGFSTTKVPTKYSGRGVGMDVVYASMQKIDGSMSIESSPGTGMKVTLNLPVTLSTMQVLCVTKNERDGYMPTSFIQSVVSWEEDHDPGLFETITINSVEYEPLHPKVSNDTRALVLVKRGSQGYYLPCSKLGTYETLFAKKLPDAALALLGDENCYLGCAIDTLGRVLCIMDVDRLIEQKETSAMAFQKPTTMKSIDGDLLDALGEIGNVGSGGATSMLSGILGQRVTLQAPRVLSLSKNLDDLADVSQDQVVMGIMMRLAKTLGGIVVILVDLDCISNLVQEMTGQRFEGDQLIEDEDALSAVHEIANMMAASYMNAIGAYTGLRIYLEPMMVGLDMAAALVSYPLAQMSLDCEDAICIDSSFSIPQPDKAKCDDADSDDTQGFAEGRILILPDDESVLKITKALGL